MEGRKRAMAETMAVGFDFLITVSDEAARAALKMVPEGKSQDWYEGFLEGLGTLSAVIDEAKKRGQEWKASMAEASIAAAASWRWWKLQPTEEKVEWPEELNEKGEVK